MKTTPILALFAAAWLSILPHAASGSDTTSRSDTARRAEALWAGREDIAKAREAVAAYEELLAAEPGNPEILVRLSRLHYWIGQNLEAMRLDEAISHYERGMAYASRATDAAPDRPGGYFFEAVSLARIIVLREAFKDFLKIRDVRKLQEKAGSLQPDYFYSGSNRFLCAYYTRLPSLLGGSTKKAIEFGKRAVAAHPEYAGNRLYLAEAYHRNGSDDLARRELEAALASPDDALPDAIPEQKLEKRRAQILLERIGK